MTIRDAVELATAIVTSLGGGGALVFGLSGHLGKLWADRALEQERHKYADLLMNAKDNLERAASRYKVELDRLGLVHKLRTTEEFSHLGSLWKHMAILSSAFNSMSSMGIRFVPADESEREKHQARLRANFEGARAETHKFFLEEKLFIPKSIADCAESALTHALREGLFYQAFYDHHDPQVRSKYSEEVPKFLDEFNKGMTNLEIAMREYIEGQESNLQ
jgi:hypothetical protein